MTVSAFERAVDAVVDGDGELLRSLLAGAPGLIRARSMRSHRATLLHYLGANGLEDYRQKSPGNAVEIARILLDAGAEVDALAEIYGQSSTLSLVASSVHPEKAGVQIALLDVLLEYGAAIDGPGGVASPVLPALRNGHPGAAEYLAKRGARLDLESAAGLGELDVVKSFLGEDGDLRATAMKAQMEDGFLWACEYGRDAVVEFLLENGVDIATQGTTGQSGLHWAVIGRQLATIDLLLKRGASLEATNRYGGTALGQALWSASQPGAEDYEAVIAMLTNRAPAQRRKT